ncbi:MAG TPA: glycosyltransferase family 4 protein [Candidatus Methylomirabilis sp.]|nr:glycosyltransferase family 4 protein [Candidatus Methylomirabilis sp.]
MRIAMIGAKGVPASMSAGGGVERHIEELSRRLAEHGHDVTIYVRSYNNTLQRKTWKGCRLVTLPTIRRKNFETIVHVLLSTIHAIGRRYDVIHYHGVGPSTLAWIPRVFAPRSKVVVTFHSQDKFHEKWNIVARAYLAWGEWTAVRFPHRTISVSHVIQQYCRRMFDAEIVYIPNGVDVPTEVPGTDRLEGMGLRPNGYFLGLGRLVPQKAFDLALEAYRGVSTPIAFAIAGAPSYDLSLYERLHALAKDDPRVRLLGYRTGEELQQLLAHCYAVVHPSRTEGLSLSILEAMAHGKLVVMSDIPENLEVIDHAGISFKTDDREALRNVLAWLVQDPELVRKRGQRARDIVKRLYAWDTIVAKTETVYAALITRA